MIHFTQDQDYQLFSSHSSMSSDDDDLEDDNLNKIVKGLYLGNYKIGTDLEQVSCLGFTLVLSLENNPYRFYNYNCKFKQVNIRDQPDEDIISYFDECFEAIDNEIENKGKVLIHCRAGVSRSATIAIAYLMKKNKIPYDKASEMVKKKRQKIRPNKGFIAQLELYQAMNYFCDVTFYDYRLFILIYLRNQIVHLKPWEDPMAQVHFTPITDYLKKLQSQNVTSQIVNSNDEYKCKFCDAPLFSQINALFNMSIDHFDQHSIEMLNSFCKYIFIEPKRWMLPKIINKQKGNIRCHQCHKKLGIFNWETYECDCFIHTQIQSSLVFRMKRCRVKKSKKKIFDSNSEMLNSQEM